MTRRSMPCLFHANLFALGVARWRCQNIDGYAVQEAAGRLVSRWSSALPAGSLDYQAPCRHSRVAGQNYLKGHIYLNNLIPCLLLLVGVVWGAVATWFKRWWRCHLFLQVKRPVSLVLVGETGLFVYGLVDWRRQ